MMTTDEILRLDVPFPRESLGVRWDAYNDWVREEGWVPTIEREEQLEGRLCYFGRRRIPNEAEELAERPPYYSESVGAGGEQWVARLCTQIWCLKSSDGTLVPEVWCLKSGA